MANVNGSRPPNHDGPSHDMPLLGPHGAEGLEALSAGGAHAGSGGGSGSGSGSTAWARNGSPIHHRPSISILAGAQDGSGQSKQPALRTRRTYLGSVRKPQSFLESLVSVPFWVLSSAIMISSVF
jgi:hypothetical protein